MEFYLKEKSKPAPEVLEKANKFYAEMELKAIEQNVLIKSSPMCTNYNEPGKIPGR